MAGRDAGPTRALLMGSAGLRAGDWLISGTVGHTFCHIVNRALVSELESPIFEAIWWLSQDHLITVCFKVFCPFSYGRWRMLKARSGHFACHSCDSRNPDSGSRRWSGATASVPGDENSDNY
jgi:hypothetical protein